MRRENARQSRSGKGTLHDEVDLCYQKQRQCELVSDDLWGISDLETFRQATAATSCHRSMRASVVNSGKGRVSFHLRRALPFLRSALAPFGHKGQYLARRECASGVVHKSFKDSSVAGRQDGTSLVGRDPRPPKESQVAFGFCVWPVFSVPENAPHNMTSFQPGASYNIATWS